MLFESGTFRDDPLGKTVPLQGLDDIDGVGDIVGDGVPLAVGEQLGAKVSPGDAHAFGQGQDKHTALEFAPVTLL